MLITSNKQRKSDNFHELTIETKRILGLKLGQIQVRINMTCAFQSAIKIHPIGKTIGSSCAFFKESNLIGFANNVSKERQHKGYCLISNENDFWKCAMEYTEIISIDIEGSSYVFQIIQCLSSMSN